MTHWSTRLLAKKLGLSDYTVAKAWRDYGVQPWRAESFRFSTDPQLEAKVIDIVGLYLNPPENAIVLATGHVTAALKPRHRNQEFAAFLKQVERAYRDVVDEHGDPVELHLVMDNYAAHKHANVKAWLAENPRFKVHFTPTHASWMNLVEV